MIWRDDLGRPVLTRRVAAWVQGEAQCSIWYSSTGYEYVRITGAVEVRQSGLSRTLAWAHIIEAIEGDSRPSLRLSFHARWLLLTAALRQL